MKTNNTHVKKLAVLLGRIKRKGSADEFESLDAVTQLVMGFLQWNSTHRAAEAAHDRLMEVMVDNNDLRVSHDREIMSIIGENYPRATERIARMREAMNELFNREHAVSLESLRDKPKKEARAYLESLRGMPPYVAAQVTLLCFGGHAIPVDDKLAELLAFEQVVPDGASAAEVGSFLERHIKAGDAVDAHLALQAWADSSRRKLDAAETPKIKQKVVRKTAKSAAAKTNKKTPKRSTPTTKKKIVKKKK